MHGLFGYAQNLSGISHNSGGGPFPQKMIMWDINIIFVSVSVDKFAAIGTLATTAPADLLM